MADFRAFRLQRLVDETGISGTGFVAEGVQFSDGTVALRWLSDWPTSVVFHDRGIDAVIAVHGHGGKTRVVWAYDWPPDAASGPTEADPPTSESPVSDRQPSQSATGLVPKTAP